MKRFILYLIRWQLSTPILWIIVNRLGVSLWSTVLANLIGAFVFFLIDKFIFTSPAIEMWHLKEGVCDDCKRVGKLRRLITASNYDRRNSKPKFLCTSCSNSKTRELRNKGIKINE